MSINPVWGETYSISEAERGRFVPLDMSTTTQYPTSGRGKFALLTYDVGTNSTAISSSGGISTAVTVISTAPTLVNTTQNYSNNTFTTVVSTITFNPIIQNIEIFNKSGNYAYISWNAIGFSALTSTGLPIPNGSYYNLDRSISAMYIGAEGANSDIRIFGHYKV